MKSLRSSSWCAVVLSLVPSLVLADEPPLSSWAQRRIEDGLLKPMAASEGNRFSRSRPLPRERRVRVTQTLASRDKDGRSFVPFAIDIRFTGAANWRENDVLGCVYVGSGNIFVKSGDAYRPGAFLLGKNLQPVAGVCEAAPPRS